MLQTRERRASKIIRPKAVRGDATKSLYRGADRATLRGDSISRRAVMPADAEAASGPMRLGASL